MTDASGRGPASGQTYNLLYDATNARITSFIDYAGRSWTFGYTGTGASSDLTCITDPVSKVTRLAYSSHALTGIVRGGATCASGGSATWTVAYTAGKATSVKSPMVTNPDTFAYAADATTARDLTDDSGSGTYADTVYHLDAAGLVAGRGLVDQVTDPEGATTSWTHDADGNVTRESIPIDADGDARIDRTYDARGNVTSETRWIDDGADNVFATVDDTIVVMASTYNATNDLLTRTDADNDTALRLVTRYTYDGSGHLTSENRNCTTSGTTILGQGAGGTCTGAGTQNVEFNIITSFAYTANDQLEFEQDPLGRVTKHVYDANGNETSVIANCTSSGTTQPSPFNTCTGAGTADAATNVVTSSAYLATDTDGKAGLPTSSVDALGRTTTYDYDALGRPKTTVLPGDASVPALTQSTTYDEYGDALNEADSWTPSGGTLQTRTTTHVYDALARETSVADPEAVTTLTTYDVAGNAIETRLDDPVDINDVVTTRSFYATRRVHSEGIGSADDALETGFGYSKIGVVSLTTRALQAPPNDPEQQVTLTKVSHTDLRGLVTTESVSSEGASELTTTTTYDKLGNVTAVDDPDPAATGGDTDNAYDRLGRLVSSTVGGRTTTYAFDRAGNQLTVTDPSGIVTTTTYDALNRATVVVANDVASPTLPSEDVTTRTYYDAAGNVVAVKDAAGFTTRTIVNARDQAVTTIANCTDSGTTPTSTPASCTGAGTHNDMTNVVTDRIYDGQGNVVKTTPVSAGRRPRHRDRVRRRRPGPGDKDPRWARSPATCTTTSGQLTDTYRQLHHLRDHDPDRLGELHRRRHRGRHLQHLHTPTPTTIRATPAEVTAPNGRRRCPRTTTAATCPATIDNYVDGVASTTDDVTTDLPYDDA